MKNYQRWRCIGLMALLVTVPVSVRGEEPAREFLDQLREAGYYDTALEYLNSIEGSPLVPVSFREVAAYERGVTNVLQASVERNLQSRENLLNEAQSQLQSFVNSNPDHYLVPAAKRQFGNLLVQRARIKVEEGKKTPLKSEMKAAQGFYDEARKLFVESRDELKVKLEGMRGIPETERELIKRRDLLRTEYLEAQLLSAAVLEEKADTTKEGTKERDQLLTDAADAYGELYEKYRRRIAGMYARMYQGRCKQKMGKLDDALGYYVSDLLSQPDAEEAFRVMKTRAMLLAVECWTDDSQKKYSEAISRMSEWLGAARPQEVQHPDWLKLRYQLAATYRDYAKLLESEKPNDKLIRTSYLEARKIATAMSRVSGPYQQDARKLLTSLPGALNQDAEDTVPKTFDEAKNAGREALGMMESTKIVMEEFPERIAQETDATIKADLEKTLNTAEQQFAQHRNDALVAFQAAVELADKEIPLEELNAVRYYVTFLLFEEGEYPDSYVIGNFVARRYPDSLSAKEAGRIAMAAALKIFTAAEGDDKEFEKQLVTGIAKYMVDTWAGEPEANEAVAALIPFEVQQGNLQGAVELLGSLPEDSAARRDGEFRIGQAYWSDCLKLLREVRELRKAAAGANLPSADLTAKEKELQSQTDKARKFLQDGLGRVEEAGPTDVVQATGVLSLIQLYVENDKSDQALALLNREKGGLLKIVDDGGFSEVGGFADEVYRQSLRAYVGQLTRTSDAGESQEVLDGAKRLMTKLSERAEGSSDGQQRLLAVYYELARDLDQRMQATLDQDEKKLLSNGLMTFLKQVGGQAEDPRILNWVAVRLHEVGKTVGGEKSQADAAKEFYEVSLDTYNRLIQMPEDAGGYLSDQRKLGFKVQRAMLLRDLGKFEESIRNFRDVLAVKNALINVQVEAARTYQNWAMESGKTANFDKALKGGYPDPKQRKNTIWGWIKLANTTLRYEQYRDAFHEAMYNRAVCRYQQARLKRNSNDKKKYMQAAKNEISQVFGRFSDMGGSKWRPQYDALLRKIQKELGEAQRGISGLSSTRKKKSKAR